MRKWKQVTSCCMAAALAATMSWPAMAASPPFARTAQEWAKLKDNVMEYDELPGLVHEYNATVQNNQADYNKKKADGDVTADDIAQSYRDQADDVRARMTGNNAQDTSLEIQAEQLDQQADNNVFDLETYKLQYDQQEANLVVQAQNDMIAYQQKLLQLEAAKKNREVLDAAYQAEVAKKQVGSATQMDVLTAQENLQKADASITQSEADIQKLKQTLCVMLGWRYDASPEIKDIPKADMARIQKMNPAADLAKALASNYSLNINKRKLANATAETTKVTLNNTIKDNEQKIGASLENAYQAVLQAKAAYDQAVSDYNFEKQNMANGEAKFKTGYISKLAYDQEQSAYLSKQIGVQVADMDLFKAMEAYGWSVNGLASVQ